MASTSGFNIDNASDPNNSIDNEIEVGDEIYISKSGPFRILKATFLGRKAVIKCLKPKFAHSFVHQRLIRREGNIISSLHHSAIVTSFGLHNISGYGASIVLELLEGLSLSQYVKSESIGLNQAVSLLSQICDVVAYINSNGIIHRDLKPENIIVLPESGKIKLIDFGLSHGEAFEDHSFPGGTHGFSAPEQFDSDNKPSPTADIWSIGKLMEVILPTIKPVNIRKFLHPGETAWQDTIDYCTRSNPSERPQKASVVKEYFFRRFDRFKRLRNFLAAGIACILLSIILTIGIFREKYNYPDIATSTNSKDATMGLDSTGLSTNMPDLNNQEIEILTGNELPENSVATENLEIPISKQENLGSANFVENSNNHFDDSSLRNKEEKDLIAAVWSSLNKHYKWHIKLLRSLDTEEEANMAMDDIWINRVRDDFASYVQKHLPEWKKSKLDVTYLNNLGNNEIDRFIYSHEPENDWEKHKMINRTELEWEFRPSEIDKKSK